MSHEVERLAFRLLLDKKLSPEKAFKLAVKRLKRRGDLRAFRKFLADFYYLSSAYPGRDFDELFELSLKGSYPFLPPRWVTERARRRLSYGKPYWLRVNTLRTSVEEARKALREKGVRFEEDGEFPYFLKLSERIEVKGLDLFVQGKVVPQDKSAAYVVRQLDPKEGELIFDVGSAPGMKASLIQQVRNNRGEVIAIDVSVKRVREEREVLKWLGVKNVELVVADGAHLPFRKLTKVLVDAPCSNSGTYVEDPSVFLRITPRDVRRFSSFQKGILREVMSLKPYKVVYSVCSIFPDEGEKVVEDVLKRGAKLEGELRLYPDTHGTDGFYIASLSPERP
ncbi:MAG: RsmB/NOP family class I SAM-dependent RNA methyltransferase [Thermoprotei archaeon]